MPRISSRWSGFSTSIFTVMTQKAVAHGAVNLAQGFPDFDGPEIVKRAATAAIMSHHNQYAPSAGIGELRKLLAERRKKKHQGSYDWQREVTIYSGATEAIFCAFQAFFSAGDEILAFEPFFDCYPAAAHSAGAKIVGVPLLAPHFNFTQQQLAQAVSKNTRALILNSPHNPTGRVFSDAELELLRDFVISHDLLVITDEVYEELTYGSAKHQSVASLPGMQERTVVISSTAKTFSFTGWKIGYAFAPPELTEAMRAVHQYTVFCSAAPLQVGMIAALELPETYYDQFRADYLERRDLLIGELRASGFRVEAPEGTYFVVADFSQLSSDRDQDFANDLTEKVKVAAIPLSVFFTSPDKAAEQYHYVRFAFCKNRQTLAAAGRNLRNLGQINPTV